MVRGEIMKREIPKVYANKIDKEIKNNEKVVYTQNEDSIIEKTADNFTTESKVDKLKRELNGNINQKIKNIFNSKNYIYKADVVITLKDKKINKRIIGKNGNYLITYDNELIAISDIVDIEYK